MGLIVPIEGCEGLACFELFDSEQVSLILHAQVEARGVIASVPEYRKNMVPARELAQVQAVTILVEALYVLVEPYILASYGADALALELYALDRGLADQIAPRSLALDGELGEIVFADQPLEFKTRPKAYPDRLRLAVVVDREPEYGRTRGAHSNVIFLVPGDRCHREALGVVAGVVAVLAVGLAVTVYAVVDSPAVVTVEDACV